MKYFFCIVTFLILTLSLCSKHLSYSKEKNLSKKNIKKVINNSNKDISGFIFLGTKSYTVGGKTNIVNEYKHRKTGLEFVLIPGGKYYIWGEGNKVNHVKLKPFLICKTETTQKLWKKVMKTEPWKGKHKVKVGENYPASYINWYQAFKFCKKLGARLPTEVEWEVACRARTKTKYFWGSSIKNANKYAIFQKDSFDFSYQHSQKVGLKKPNGYGLFDMLGNVWEWCQDVYEEKYPNKKNSSYKKDDLRVSRGGSFRSDENELSLGYRGGGVMPESKDNDTGFRIVFPLPADCSLCARSP